MSVRAQTLPAIVRVGCIHYAVKELDELKCEEGQRIYGQIAPDVCEIRIWGKLSPQAKRITLWHEVMHAILMNAGYTFEHDEQMVSAITYGICDVLANNPDLAKEVEYCP